MLTCYTDHIELLFICITSLGDFGSSYLTDYGVLLLSINTQIRQNVSVGMHCVVPVMFYYNGVSHIIFSASSHA